MKKLKDVPVIFVHYPQGAGGWFLSSLIYYTFNRRCSLKVDHKGSGHINTDIENLNNFYYYFSDSEKCKEIIESKNLESFSREDRITHLQNAITVNPGAEAETHVISLHCKDINLFLEAFPQARCVQIIVDDDDLVVCALNFIYKIVSLRDVEFYNFAKEYNREDDDIKMDLEHLKNPDNRILNRIAWAVEHIKKTSKSVSNDPKYNDRFFEINYRDYMFANIDDVLGEVLNFCHRDLEYYQNLVLDDKIYPEVYFTTMQYRACQKRYIFD